MYLIIDETNEVTVSKHWTMRDAEIGLCEAEIEWPTELFFIFNDEKEECVSSGNDTIH